MNNLSSAQFKILRLTCRIFILLALFIPAFAAAQNSAAISSLSFLDPTTLRVIPGLRRISGRKSIALSSLPPSGILIRAHSTRGIRRVSFQINRRPVQNVTIASTTFAQQATLWRPVAGRLRITASAQRSTARPLTVLLDISAPVAAISRPNRDLPVPAGAPEIPKLAQWEANMTRYARHLCIPEQIRSYALWEGNLWYYDGVKVLYQIADYTGDVQWQTCAQVVRDVYRPHVLSSRGQVGGWRVFPYGLAEDYFKSGNIRSKNAALLLATNSPFAAAGGGESFELSRETAFLIHALLSAEDLGNGRSPHLDQAVTYALGHLNQWTGIQSASYVKPFMVGLTMEALIRYYDYSGDARILDAVRNAADWLWDHAWDGSRHSFPYIICKAGATPGECFERNADAADLNLLIAPAYAWIYNQTADVRYQQRGDAIFDGGVSGAWLNNGKQFSQNYRWSFDFVRWRSGKRFLRD